MFFAEFALDIPLYILFTNIRPFIKQLFSLADTELNLYLAIFQIYIKGNQGKALFLNLSDETLDFVLMHKKLFGTIRIMVEDRGIHIRRNMKPHKPNLARPYLRKGVGKGKITRANGLDLRSFENDSAFNRIVDRVVEVGFSVVCEVLYRGSTHRYAIIEVAVILVNESPSW